MALAHGRNYSESNCVDLEIPDENFKQILYHHCSQQFLLLDTIFVKYA